MASRGLQAMRLMLIFATTAASASGLMSEHDAVIDTPQHPLVREAVRYMTDHRISHACMVLLATAGNRSKVEIDHGTGDAVLDQKFVDGLIWGIDHKWMKLNKFGRDGENRRVLNIDMDLQIVGGRVLGCGAHPKKIN